MSLVSYAASDDSGSESEDLEETTQTSPLVSKQQPGNAEAKIKPAENVTIKDSTPPQSAERKIILNLPQPSSRSRKRDSISVELNEKKTKEKIKIPMFSFKFRKIDSDDDDDDDDRGRSKTITGPSKKGSGLMALLPQPKNSISLGGAGGNKIKVTKTNNLVPYTLTKQKDKKDISKAAIVSVEPKLKNKIAIVDNIISDDDDNDNTTEFFTFHQKPDPNLIVEQNIISLEDRPGTSSEISTSVMQIPDGSTEEHVSDDFNDYKGVTAPYGSSEDNINYEVDHQETIDQEQGTVSSYEAPQQVDGQLELDDEAIRQLQGRRKRKEEIKFIDVNGADQQCSAEQYLKNITEQTGYSSKSSKKDLPSGGSKRKHQITYLAMQAKAREFELQNEWSSSRTTKRVTQQRYGF